MKINSVSGYVICLENGQRTGEFVKIPKKNIVYSKDENLSVGSGNLIKALYVEYKDKTGLLRTSLLEKCK